MDDITASLSEKHESNLDEENDEANLFELRYPEEKELFLGEDNNGNF